MHLMTRVPLEEITLDVVVKPFRHAHRPSNVKSTIFVAPCEFEPSGALLFGRCTCFWVILVPASLAQKITASRAIVPDATIIQL